MNDLNDFGSLVPKHLCEALLAENARLKGEVERLTKAGDEIEVNLRSMMGDWPRSLAEGWKEAKQGQRR